jgi:hypothetical protein
MQFHCCRNILNCIPVLINPLAAAAHRPPQALRTTAAAARLSQLLSSRNLDRARSLLREQFFLFAQVLGTICMSRLQLVSYLPGPKLL